MGQSYRIYILGLATGLFFSFNIYASDLQLPYVPDRDQVRVINHHGVDLYENYEQNVQIIWELVKENAAFEQTSNIVNPVLVFEEFDQQKNPQEWIRFQQDWYEKYQLEKPFNASRLPGYFYINTPFIQIRSSYVNEAIPMRPIGPYLKGAKQAYYTAGHEFYHYILDQLDVPVELHHCVMLNGPDRQSEGSLSRTLLNGLKGEGLGNDKTDAVYYMEVRGFPCNHLNEQELEKVEQVILELERRRGL